MLCSRPCKHTLRDCCARSRARHAHTHLPPQQVGQPAILAFQQLAQLLPPARATAASKRAVDRLEAQGSDDGTLAAVRLLAHTVSSWTPEALRRHVPRYVGRWIGHRDFTVREVRRACVARRGPCMQVRSDRMQLRMQVIAHHD